MFPLFENDSPELDALQKQGKVSLALLKDGYEDWPWAVGWKKAAKHFDQAAYGLPKRSKAEAERVAELGGYSTDDREAFEMGLQFWAD
ncbi:hypothetical protein WJX84_011568 [Apatococcus fuscideae]|uniref:Uncharacterized protein n=1 Tax=Apatococcus fuscideae TaxID=2026836 RepID=A0AAW1TJ15_9CHLO